MRANLAVDVRDVPRHGADAKHKFTGDFGIGAARGDELRARPGCVLVPVRDYNTLAHLDQAVTETDTSQRDIVVLTIRLMAFGSLPAA